jgi:RNA polymerase sigma-70 factor (ECF subfamily)
MPALAEKHKNSIEEAVARLLSRAENSRGLQIADLSPRVGLALEKYLFADNENASGADVEEFVDALRADDFCLIIACEKGDETAWSDLVKNFDQTVKSAARKISNNSEDAEDLASSIWAELHGLKRDENGKLKTKLSYYSGRGSLGGWLRAIVSQLAIDQYRLQARLVQIEENREFENLAHESAENSDNQSIVSHSENPEELFSETEAQQDVSNALTEAISALEGEDRLILKLYYFDELKLKEIGGALGFHEATASRKLVRVQTEIRKSVEKILQTKHGWQRDEVRRFLSETASKLGISFEKIFTIMLISALVQESFRSCVL